MNIHTYIDYIDDPNDTYEQYLEKAKSIISAVSLRRLTLMMKPLLI